MKIDETITIEESKTTGIYFQTWVAGVRGGGSGLNLVISKSFLKDIIPKQVYFRNKISTVEKKEFDFIAYYKGELNQLENINTEDEGNRNESDKTFPFDLKDNEAIISYLSAGKIKYLRVVNITEKESIPYPSVRPQN